MEKLSIDKYLGEFTKDIRTGIFLTAKDEEKINTMTIGWGFSGIMWSKPVVVVAVRYSRYTYELMEKSNEFTVSIPAEGTLKDALAFCGSKSGRDTDKFEECNLTKEYIEPFSTPVIGECETHFICKKIYQQSLEPSLMMDDAVTKYYGDHDYHVMYYGEVVGLYRK